MGSVILVCGLNGAGKSTLAKALAERLNLRFIDIEDIYFSRQTIRIIRMKNPVLTKRLCQCLQTLQTVKMTLFWHR